MAARRSVTLAGMVCALVMGEMQPMVGSNHQTAAAQSKPAPQLPRVASPINTSASFSPDGTQLVAVGNAIRLFDV